MGWTKKLRICSIYTTCTLSSHWFSYPIALGCCVCYCFIFVCFSLFHLCVSVCLISIDLSSSSLILSFTVLRLWMSQPWVSAARTEFPEMDKVVAVNIRKNFLWWRTWSPEGRLKESDLQQQLMWHPVGGWGSSLVSSPNTALRLLWFKGAGRGFPDVFPKVPRLIPHGNWAKTWAQ